MSTLVAFSENSPVIRTLLSMLLSSSFASENLTFVAVNLILNFDFSVQTHSSDIWVIYSFRKIKWFSGKDKLITVSITWPE